MSAGAYGFVMASNYNTRPRAARGAGRRRRVPRRPRARDARRSGARRAPSLRDSPSDRHGDDPHSPRCTAPATTTSTSTASTVHARRPGRAGARAVSPRRTGIGSDGLILIRPSAIADCRMEMYNADGSRGEMCGNGIRCVGKYVYDHGLAQREPAARRDRRRRQDARARRRATARCASVTVDMGAPILDRPRIPVARRRAAVIDAPLEVDGRDLPRHLRLDGQSALRALRRRGRARSTSRRSARASSITRSSRSA